MISNELIEAVKKLEQKCDKLEAENKQLRECLEDCKKYSMCKAPDKIFALINKLKEQE